MLSVQVIFMEALSGNCILCKVISLPLSEKKPRSIFMVDVKLVCWERYILLQVVGDMLHMRRDLYEVRVCCDVMIHECRARSGLHGYE